MERQGSLVTQTVKNLPAILVRSLGQEDPLEEGVATYSSTLAWRIPWTEEPVLAGYSSWDHKNLTQLTARIICNLKVKNNMVSRKQQ